MGAYVCGRSRRKETGNLFTLQIIIILCMTPKTRFCFPPLRERDGSNLINSCSDLLICEKPASIHISFLVGGRESFIPLLLQLVTSFL